MTVVARCRELLLLAGAIYLFPIAILAVFVPLALVIKGLLIAADWAWRAVL